MSQNILIISFTAILSIGCFWQIVKVCEFYFNYPTNVFIDTTFDPISKPLPALTFCIRIYDNLGLNSSYALEIQSSMFKYEVFHAIYIQGESNRRNLTDDYLDSVIERIALKYYCITFNSLLSGQF